MAWPHSTPGTQIRAVEVLKTADVVLFDDLANESALDAYCSSTCERVYVGKRGGQASTPQADINQMLIDKCTIHQHVVRLKGGCPSVFARVSSELQALRRAAITVNIVPGVSSTLAAPLAAGFPLTEPTVGARSISVFSAHDPASLPAAAIAQLDTVVLLMVGRQLSAVVARLLEGGCNANTPVCIIHRACSPQQRVYRAPLRSIVQAVRMAMEDRPPTPRDEGSGSSSDEGEVEHSSDVQSLSPAVMVVGRVAAAPLFASSMGPDVPPFVVGARDGNGAHNNGRGSS